MPTMILSSRQYPDRAEVPNTLWGSVPVARNASVTLDAPPEIIAANSGSTETKYKFLFWHTNRIIVGTSAVTFGAPSDDATFFATAWYVPKGGGGGGSVGLTTVAFSTDRDEVFADTPIASATPNGAWAGPPATFVSTTTSSNPVVATAKVLIDGFGEFASWLAFIKNVTVSARTVTVPPNVSALAIAAYGIPQPDPCALLRDQRDNLNPGDFPSPEAFKRALAAANARLHQCEKLHGEPLD